MFCDGIWCEDRVVRAGYLSRGLCPVCNQPDSIHHRLYKCEGSTEIKNAREAVQATDFFFQQAQEGAQEFFSGL
eukprot:4899141-Pyramimonas_sp.AAC.1